ncbi:MAG: twin-arginine translocase subunit TatC [Sphingomonadaceae bacterium]|uniref:twin-arginine translocase subunit TatC n=1 Tax=Thermaurantiacus sp. TaxID=2820283 RepID=UPI00298F05E3|nr:twin-arginine translocase subunit TatC [Thermaurantiacus sp.]MCS6987671.1 twin-arginine translocase subunit TatC [Sphingomonadaceae bacterium]MDW8415272.1 twin-arginine translocase subunit TatC [Thermaurantiacus sp.]
MLDDIDDTPRPLVEHLIELRQRLLWSLAAFLVAFLACFAWARPIFSVLVQPLVAAGQDRVIFTQMFEAFLVQVRVAFFAALMLAFPVIAIQVWKFVAPGLYRREKAALLPFLVATPFLFGAGAAFAYFVAIPVALKFLLGFEGDLGGIAQEALPSVGAYLSFVMQFLFAFGVAFLLPVLLVLLVRAGLLSLDHLVKARRYAIVAAFVVAAIFTPPDVVSQLLLAIPLILLYETSILAIRVTERRQRPAAVGSPQEGAAE